MKEHQIIRFVRKNIRPAHPGAPLRLYYPEIRGRSALQYSDVANDIHQDETFDYFIDTNFFTGPEIDQCVWEALLSRRLTITGCVWQELADWIANPFRNRCMAKELANARGTRNATILFDDQANWGSPCGVFRAYYTNLLAERKRRAVSLVEKFKESHHREPTEVEKAALFQKGYTERDTVMFSKGFDEIIGNRNVFTDEELVSTAAMVSLATGRNTTILTRDHDVFEQFYKLTGLLTVHYQATLFADRFASERDSFIVSPLPMTPETNAYFVVNESLLVAKPVNPDSFLAWLLPRQYDCIRMCCILFTGFGDALRSTRLEFIAETPMLQLLEEKGGTKGLNTSRLDGLNCHVTGFPLGVPNPRCHVILGRDRTVDTPEKSLVFPLLELVHAVYHFEDIRSYHDPNRTGDT